MKSFLCSSALLAASALVLTGQNTPPAPVPHGTGAVPGSSPPGSATAAAAAAATEPSSPVDPASPDELKQYGLDRYDKIVEKSPFNFKIIKQTGPPPISFAADLALAGFTIDAGKNTTYASIVDKKKNARFVINDQAPNKEGIQLVKLNRGQTLLASTVLARKGGEEHEIKAEKQIVERKAVVAAAVLRGNAPQAAAGQPGQPGGLPGVPPQGPGIPNRGNDIQNRINNSIQAPAPGGAPIPPPQPAGNPQQAAVQPTPAATVADQAIQRQNSGGGQRGDGQQPPPNKRRVILPPPVNTQ